MTCDSNTLAVQDLDDVQSTKQGQVPCTYMLPKKMSPTKKAFESIGFTFEDVEDDIFYQTTLPKGWTIDNSSNKSLTFLIDHKGRKRVTYYRDYPQPFMSLIRKFCINFRPVEQNSVIVSVDDSDGHVIASIGSAFRGSDMQDYLVSQSKEFLNSNYPDWENPCKYWD